MHQEILNILAFAKIFQFCYWNVLAFAKYFSFCYWNILALLNISVAKTEVFELIPKIYKNTLRDWLFGKHNY